MSTSTPSTTTAQLRTGARELPAAADPLANRDALLAWAAELELPLDDEAALLAHARTTLYDAADDLGLSYTPGADDLQLSRDVHAAAAAAKPRTAIGSILSGICRRNIAAKVLADAGLSDDTPATDEQIKRASSKAKPGLKGKARAIWILTGQDSQRQVAAAKTARAAGADTTTAASTPRSSGPREGSALHAAMTILGTATEPLTADEIYKRAKAKGLAGGLKGKTPIATLAAQMATANKKGLYVERTAPGRYQLRK